MAELDAAVARHRARLAKGEQAAFNDLTRAYGETYTRVTGDLDRLVLRMEAAVVSGEEISPSWLSRQERLSALQAKLETETTRFAQLANTATEAAQGRAVVQGVVDATELLDLGAAGVVGSFLTPSTAALDALVGHLADGSPLARLFAALPGDASDRATKALMAGVGRGLNPRLIARDMRDALGGNLNRALTIARTETLRAYRGAAQQTYEANADILEGWLWTCARQLRTCALCWAMDGTVHPVTATLDSHPNCRCTPVPVTKFGFAEHPPPAREAFDRLTPDQQRAILGNAKLEAYRSGELDLRDLVGRHDHPEWGTTRNELSLRDARALQGDGNLAHRLGEVEPKALKPAKKRPSRAMSAEQRAARNDLEPYRQMVRREAERVAEAADAQLERLEGGRMIAPPPRKIVSDRIRGRVARSDAGGEWDWFYQLDPAEQKRLRRDWVGAKGEVLGPDNITDLMAERFGITDPDEAIERWLQLTREHDAAKALKLGKLPSEDAYGGMEVDALLPEMRDEGFSITRLLDNDFEDAVAHVAEVNEGIAGTEAARMLPPRLTSLPRPWTMTEGDYVAELDGLYDRLPDIHPLRVDELEGAVYDPADQAVLDRLAELEPDDLLDPGEGNLTPAALHARMVELAQRAGLEVAE